MAKSDRTLEELQAAALLLGDGWFYDWIDHTFNSTLPNDDVTVFCADTMEPMDGPYGYLTYDTRKQQVKAGLLGTKDLNATTKEVRDEEWTNDDQPVHRQAGKVYAASGGSTIGHDEPAAEVTSRGKGATESGTGRGNGGDA